MDKVVAKVKQTRHNWWEAFKLSLKIRGYEYYKPPPEIKYRYPAPGSCALTPEDRPNLYKKHWKTPFRESPYNIQIKEKRLTHLENTDHYINEIPSLDLNDPTYANLRESPLPVDNDRFFLTFDQQGKSYEEKRDELWECFEAAPEHFRQDLINDTPWHYGNEDDYHQAQMLWYERGATGFQNEKIMQTIFVELENIITDFIGAKQIKTKQKEMYKGTIKKWQVLDDEGPHDREEIKKIQAAIKAPLPDELDLAKEQQKTVMQLPFTNDNVSKWRDDQRAIDTADFDPKLIEVDRERRKQFYLERYEKSKELTQH